MADEIEKHLRSHDKAFEGLMSLIPAEQYYAADNSDQWQRKKQTKREKKEARRAKLDPSSRKSAKDVMDENELKRKRELAEEDEDDIVLTSQDIERPRQGLKTSTKPAKKQKLEDSAGKENGEADDAGDDEEARRRAKVEKRREKQERKKEKEAKKQEKAVAKKQQRLETEPQADVAMVDMAISDLADTDLDHATNDMEQIDMPDLVPEAGVESLLPATTIQASNSVPAPADSTASPSPTVESSSSANASSTSSKTSVEASNATEGTEKASQKPTKIKLPDIDPELLKARLQARIDALRAARKADGPDGRPARTRQELIDARRKKEEQRRAHKKELRAQAKEDEMKAKAEAELARLRGSGSPASHDIFSPKSPESNNFQFGKVQFEDGQQVDAGSGALAAQKKKKGPSDVKTALTAAQRKKMRLAALDEMRRADIEEKDTWLNAKKRAHGERVKDDENLLKKALKRKEKAKDKSEQEWKERIQGVEKGKEMRQKKREENLKKRREEKGSHGKKGAKVAKKKRPGFEGSFKARSR